MADIKTILPNEVDRRRLDKRTIQSVYQAGYSIITVKSIFSTGESYSNLLCRIIKRKLDMASIS